MIFYQNKIFREDGEASYRRQIIWQENFQKLAMNIQKKK